MNEATDIDMLIHDLEANLRMMEMADEEWVIQDGCSWRRIGTRTGRNTDGTVLRPYAAPDGHPDLQSAYGVLLHIRLSQPRNIRLLLSEIEHLRQELAEARDRNLIANERADNAVADLDKLASVAEEARVVLEALGRPKDENRQPSGSELMNIWALVIAAEQKLRRSLAAHKGREG